MCSGGYARTFSISDHGKIKGFSFNVKIKISNPIYVTGQKILGSECS